MKKKPTGFVAICQCGKFIGALDYNQIDRKEAGRILGEWISDGCKIEPRFSSSWSVDVSSCECVKESRSEE